MDIQRVAQLAGVLLESDDRVSSIKGKGKHWFYLVYDIRDEGKSYQSTTSLGDVIAKVKIGSLLDIANAHKNHHEFMQLNPELYPESEKDAAIADAKARIAKLPERA